MYPLFETIRYKNGVPENLYFHQQRLNHTLNQLSVKNSILLSDHIHAHPNKPGMDNKVYKCRFLYDLTGNVHIHFEPYDIKIIKTFSMHDMGVFQYEFKFTDRTWINNIVLKSNTDEVIFTQNGYIKDASYANIVFFDGSHWVTPKNPLLMGTRRAALLSEGIIKEKSIHINDLYQFVEFKLINAMMLWEESPCYSIELL